jgi:sugar lactone lactonase YvrE
MLRCFLFAAAALGLLLAIAVPAGAWDRGKVDTFAVLPAFAPNGGACPAPSAGSSAGATCVSDAEGVAVGPDGTIYVPSFGFNKNGALTGNGELFVINPSGKVTSMFPVLGSSPHLIGGAFQASSNTVLIPDLGSGKVWQVDPVHQTTKLFMTAPNPTSAGLNAMAFDKSGNVYVSDSFQGAIWMTGPAGGAVTQWAQNALLLPAAATGEALVPPFGANGIAFNNEGTAMFVNNTAYHSIIEIPVNSDGSAGTPTVFTTGINAPDGIAVDKSDNLWVLANQGDEVVVVDPTGKVIAKKGDFDGIDKNGTIKGLLFPASNTFSPDGQYMYITNLALYLPYAGQTLPIAVDSGWTLQVEHYNVARIAVGPIVCISPCCLPGSPVCCAGPALIVCCASGSTCCGPICCTTTGTVC